MEFYYYYYFLNYFSQEGVQKRGPNLFFYGLFPKKIPLGTLDSRRINAMSEKPQKAIWNSGVKAYRSSTMGGGFSNNQIKSWAS